MTAKGCDRAKRSKGKVLMLPSFFHGKTQHTHQNSMRSMCMNTSLTNSCSWVGKWHILLPATTKGPQPAELGTCIGFSAPSSALGGFGSSFTTG